MRRTLLLVIGVVGSLVASGLPAQDSPPDDDPAFWSGARVRAQISVPAGYEDEWFTGVATSSVEGCGLLVLRDVPSAYVAPDGTVLVAYQDVIGLEVSSLYDGWYDPKTYENRDYTPDKPLKGEEWIEVSVDSLKAADPTECARPR